MVLGFNFVAWGNKYSPRRWCFLGRWERISVSFTTEHPVFTDLKVLGEAPLILDVCKKGGRPILCHCCSVLPIPWRGAGGPQKWEVLPSGGRNSVIRLVRGTECVTSYDFSMWKGRSFFLRSECVMTKLPSGGTGVSACGTRGPSL